MLLKTPFLKFVWKKYKFPLLYIYFLSFVEELCYLLIPSAVGLMIDSIIYEGNFGFLVFPLVYFGWQGIGLVRRIKDTKVFTLIHKEVSLIIIEEHYKKNEEVTLINARVELLKSIIEFFQNDLIFVFKSIVSVMGSSILLYYYNPKLLWVSLLVLIPSLIINRLYSKKITSATIDANNLYEQQIKVIESKNLDEIRAYFDDYRKKNILKSNLEAYNFSFLEIFVFIMIFISIYIVCKTENLNYGDIVASYGIILRFAYGFDFIPYSTTKIASIKDITSRINEFFIEK